MGALNLIIMEPKIQNKSSVAKSAMDYGEGIKICESQVQILRDEEDTQSSKSSEAILKNNESVSETKIQLSFSVDRLLNHEESAISKDRLSVDTNFEKCCEQQSYPCCTHPSCLLNSSAGAVLTKPYQISSLIASHAMNKIHQPHTLSSPTIPLTDYANKCIVRPLPMRALGANSSEDASHCLPFPTLFRLHQEQQKALFPHAQSFHYANRTPPTNIALSPLLATPLTSSPKSLQLSTHLQQQQQQQQSEQQVRQTLLSSSHFPKQKFPTSPTLSAAHYHSTLHQLHHHSHSSQQHQHQHQHQPILTHLQLGSGSPMPTTQSINIRINNDDSHNNDNGQQHNNSNNNPSNNSKRKRSWSRAVFSNLQRKGLEIQFQQQKYITKPDRRKLAARLNLTDAQVKVWFQNRRMKWRHTRENLKSGQEKQPTSVNTQESSQSQLQSFGDTRHELGYSSEGSDCSMAIDEHDDEADIDVVE